MSGGVLLVAGIAVFGLVLVGLVLTIIEFNKMK